MQTAHVAAAMTCTLAFLLVVMLARSGSASNEAAHEVAVIVPFGAALAARVLVPALMAKTGPAAEAKGAGILRVRLAALVAGIAVLAGYIAGFGYELTQPPVPPANTSLASWLLEHRLTYGLSSYWTSSSVTVDSGRRVKVRALTSLAPLRPPLYRLRSR
jgi:hypothetical protein